MTFKKGLTLIFIIDILNHSVDYRKNNNYPETPYKHTKPQITAAGFCDGMVLCTQLA